MLLQLCQNMQTHITGGWLNQRKRERERGEREKFGEVEERQRDLSKHTIYLSIAAMALKLSDKLNYRSSRRRQDSSLQPVTCGRSAIKACIQYIGGREEIAQVGQLACKYTYQRHSESELNKAARSAGLPSVSRSRIPTTRVSIDILPGSSDNALRRAPPFYGELASSASDSRFNYHENYHSLVANAIGICAHKVSCIIIILMALSILPQ